MSELGTVLREAREHRQMSLDELQTITKIQKRYLKAIEQGDYNQLPGDFYARAFVKNYAEAVGIDPEELFDQYQHDIPQKRQDIVQQLPPRSGRAQKSYSGKSSKFMNVLPTILVIILLVGILYVFWLFLQQKHTASDQGTTANSGTNVQINNHMTKKPSQDQNQAKSDNTNKTQDGNTSVNDQTNSNPTQDAATQDLKVDRSNGATTYYTLSNTKQFILDISTNNAKTWLEVRENGPNGKKLQYGMLNKNQKVHLDLTKNSIVYVKVGATQAASMKINGQDFSYPNNDTTQTLYFTFKKS